MDECQVKHLIKQKKVIFHERLATKLNDPKAARKTYWSILRTFVNGSEILLIPSLPVNNEFN